MRCTPDNGQRTVDNGERTVGTAAALRDLPESKDTFEVAARGRETPRRSPDLARETATSL